MHRYFWLLLCLSLWGCSGGQAVTVMAPQPEARRPAQAPDAPEAQKDEAVDQLARSVWRRLDQTHSVCDDLFDYYPDGGARIFACHLRSLEPFARLGELFGGVIYVRGPHSNQALVLDARQDFGHYNPGFVGWLARNAIPAADDPAFRDLTQPMYDQYVRPLAQVFAVTWDKLQSDPACHQMLRDEYEGLIKQGQLPADYYEKYFFFMNPDFCGHANAGFSYFSDHGFAGGHDGNVVKSATAFWLRRTMDGTAGEFAQGLKRLRQAYEGTP